MKKLLLLFFAQIFLTSCFTMRTIVEERIIKTHEEVMDDQCNNKTKSEILLKLGAPDRSTDDGNNGEILVFDDSYTITNASGSATTSIYEIFGVPIASTNTSIKSVESKVEKEILFYVNKNNECYHWKTQGYDFTKKVIDSIGQEPVGYVDPDRNLNSEKKINQSVLKISILSITIAWVTYLLISSP